MRSALVCIALAVAQAQPAPRTAAISGRVVDDQGTPVPGAVVIAAGGPVPNARPAITTEEGRYSIGGLAADTYILSSARPGYPTIQFGQSRPGGPGAAIQVRAGERVSIDLTLPRGAVIAGTVLDDAGDQAPRNYRIVLSRAAAQTGPVRPLFIGWNARGEYRVYGLAAGTYRIAAVSGAASTNSSADVPGAITVSVAPGEERGGVDLHIASPARTGSVVIVPSAPTGIQMQYPQTVLRRPGEFRSTGYGMRNPDGSILFSNVPPGPYRAIVFSGGAWGSADISIDGERPVTVPIVMTPGKTIRGRVIFDGAAQPPERISMYLISTDPNDIAGENMGSLSGPVRPDGTFVISGVPPGRFLLTVLGGSDRDQWAILSAKVGNIDAADVPFVMGTEDLTGVAVTMTDTRASLRGVVRMGDAPANRRDVVVYPANPALRVRGSRRVAFATTAIDGSYEVKGLPAGDYAVAVLDGADREALRNPAAFAELRPTITVTLAAGETRTLNVALR